MATTVAGASLLDRVRAIAPIIQANAANAERERQLSKPTVQAMIDAGLYRMSVPQALGGLEVDAVTAIRVLEEVSRLDSAAGWNLMISTGAPSFCAWLPPEASREIFANHPDAIVCGALAPPGRAVPSEGGYRVTGRWPFASGCNHASWLVGAAFIFDKDELRLDQNGIPIQLILAFPKNEVTILDTWHTVGMRGTGSNDIAVQDVFVPQWRAAQVAPLTQLPKAFDRPLYRMTLWFAVAALAAPSLGTARAAIDALLALALKKTPAYTRSPLAERPVAQMQVARAEALLGAARAYLYDTVRDAWDTASQGQFLAQKQKIAIQLAVSHAICSAADAVDLVHQAAGTSAIRLEHPFERYFRDAHAMTQHAFGSASRFESAGKLMFGLETDWPFFAM
ncbi:MAG TPA: acyl-CoA dehydrogenase family protein [Bryobacteraceae bacterium]|nr:acyl-CoA dehydrogenase family protein [Bryobacteraceae bacterium]